jgi:hemerythrin superfamily protein
VKSQQTSTSAAALLAQPRQSATPSAESSQSAIEALKQDHRRVEGLFSEFETATEEQRKQELVAMICAELNIHTLLEEEIFYPACREAIDGEDIMDEAQVEHDAAKLLIADLSEASGDDPFFDAKVKLLSEQIKHHVAEEEKPGEGIFAKAEEHQIDKPELAQRKQELQRRAARLRPTRAVSFNLDLTSLMEDSMARYSDSDRDDRGRFRSRDDDDDRGGRGRGRRGYFGDSEGHSRAARQRWEDDDDDRRGGSRSPYDDDDDRGGRGRGRGYFGDSEGHSRAARERWEDGDDRRGYRGRYEDDDDDRGGRGRGRGGWFGDSEGHSRAARERGGFGDYDDDRRGSRYEDDDDDRGGRGQGRGWFGDSEGHSRAARSRRDDDDDDRGGRSRSQSRRDDDDDRGGRGRGHGGWFGDPQGHARAARARWR